MKNNIAARAVSILTVAVMLFAIFGMLDGSFAAKKNRIVFQNIDSNFVLQKGKKYRIKVRKYGKAAKYRVRYKSSSKKIATVSKKGVIKGKKKGTVKITAYVKIKGKKRYKKTVKIRIGARINPGNQKVTLEKIDVAKKAMNDYNVISIDKKDIFPAFVDKCKREGILLDIWTFENKAADWDALHDILKHSGYGPAHITVDFRLW